VYNNLFSSKHSFAITEEKEAASESLETLKPCLNRKINDEFFLLKIIVLFSGFWHKILRTHCTGSPSGSVALPIKAIAKQPHHIDSAPA
jgi:hypothetical protein